MTPVIFIFLIYLLHTTGELCLSPVGLSAMTRLSVPHMVGLIMGAWFLASGAGNFAAAQIAKMTAAGGGGEDQVIEVYSKVGWMAVVVGVGLIVISPLIKRMMHLDTLGEDMVKYNAKHDLTMDGNDMVGERMSPTGDPKA
jgi:POT family proton-dependent oligopeptide transporter